MAIGTFPMGSGVEYQIAEILLANGWTITTAESCTAGLIAGTLVNADGISASFKEGFITYSNEAKMKYLGVSEQTLDAYGAVSRQTAKEMAEGAARTAGTDFAVAVTGVAGPGGGSPEKPVGLVYIACSFRGETVIKRCMFDGNRSQVRHATVMQALDLLYCQLLHYSR